MIILGVDTSEDYARVALWNNGSLAGELIAEQRFHHAEGLVPLIERLLAETGVEKKQIQLVSANRGPGSFTGLRIGLATAKGICQSLQIPLVGIDGTFVCRTQLDDSACVCVLIPNRRNLLYARWFTGMQPDSEVKVMAIEELLAHLNNERKDLLVAGSAAGSIRGQLESIPWIRVAPEKVNGPSAPQVAMLGEKYYTQDEIYTLEPQYVELSVA
ncbi:MAG: tRNA (adenosine(37)-N6)-threonylcarbamoyltransferase complex dimerization subunit type 1 TsaB [Dehalococcoidia bacterium]|nr:MAG: tRNA (adenosine(37)-N6)-threonylcarbamoyltransferase complex dimerization subunit type 1 TsaB [Dehalococcoidia bacterium]